MFSYQNFVRISHLLMRATRPAHLTPTSSLLGPNILLGSLFSNIRSTFALSVRDQVSHTYKH